MDIRTERTEAFDVAVVGGGTAGVFAAIAAARTGARTVLVEKNGTLGGTMTMGGVNFPGLFFAWGEQIISGPCWESVERTVALGGARLPEIRFRPEHHWDEQIRLNRFVYTAVLFRMCEEAGVTLVQNAMLAGAEETEDGVTLLVTDKEGLREISAAVAIDATGDATLARLLGHALRKSPIQQPATLENRIRGYDPRAVSEAELYERFRTADLPAWVSAKKLWHFLRTGRINLHIPCADADTAEGRAALERRAYATLLKVYRFYRSIGGLEGLEIAEVAAETGVRETCRIDGEWTVTAEEYVEGVFYDDSVAYAFYPIDLHVMTGIEQTFLEENVVAKIPYRALIPKGTRRILAAGRCISSDTYANSAVRVEAVCMATGQAAGCAAAIAARDRSDVRGVPYPALCEALKGIGATVPER